MKKENDELTHLFRSRLEDTGLPVREGFWEELENDIPVILSRRRQFIHRITAAASILLVLGGASAAFWYFSPKEEIADAFTQLAISTGAVGTMGADVVKEEFPAITATPVSSIPTSVTPVQLVEEYPDEETFSVSFSMSFSYTTSRNTSSANNPVGYDDLASYDGEYTDNSLQAHSTEETLEKVITGKRKRTWSVGLFTSSGLLTDRSSHHYVLPGIENPVALNAKHIRPFSVGVSVRKELSDRWGVESGLVYTHLKSEMNAENHPSVQDQKLHYLGIPIKADYSLYQNKRVNCYISAGGMVEKCISAKGEARKPSQLQLSATAAVGIACKLNDRLSVYAEPGLSYHFDDGSSVKSIRSEKPLNVNLLCGVRMTY